MGLLGESWDDPQTAAILSLAGGLLDSRNAATGLLSGMQRAMGSLQAAKDRERAIAQEQLKARLLEAQIGETQAQAQQRMAEAARMQQAQERAAAFQRDLAGGATTSQAQAMAENGGPTNAAAAAVGAPRQIDWQNLAIRYPDLIKAIEELAKANTFGKPVVARVEKGLGSDGREYAYQYDAQGNRVGDGLAQYRAPIQVNQGDRSTFVDAYGLTPLASLSINQDANSRASNAVAWANNSLANKRFAWDQQQADKPVFNADLGVVVDPRAATARPVMMDGKPIGPKDKNLPVDFTKSVGGLKELANGIDSYSRVLDANGTTGVMSQGKTRADLQSSYTALTMGLKNAFELGALAGPDLALLQGMLVDPTSPKALLLGEKGVKAQLDQAREYIRNRGRAVYEAHKMPVPDEYKTQQQQPLADMSAIEAELKKRGIFIGGN